MSESHQPAYDHAEQPQEVAGHQKEVHHCQTGTCKQPSSSTQVKPKTPSNIEIMSIHTLLCVRLVLSLELRLTSLKIAEVRDFCL